jgi:hypothetical protein
MSENNQVTEAIEHIQQQPLITVKDILVDIGVELGLLGVGVLAVLTRRQLYGLKKFIFNHLKKPKFSLDPTTHWKAQVYYWLNKLVIQEIADWGAICIFSNGEVSEYGYHFTKLRLEFTVETPYNNIPRAFFETLDATQLSIDLYGHLCDSKAPGVTRKYDAYSIYIFPIFLKNIMVACLVLGYDNPRNHHACPMCTSEIAKLFEEQIKVFQRG